MSEDYDLRETHEIGDVRRSLATLVERTVAIERAMDVLSERIHRIEKAQDVQIAELARRLDELNHAAKRLADDKMNYFSIPAAEQFQRAVEVFMQAQRDVNSKLSTGIVDCIRKNEYADKHSDLAARIAEALPRIMFEQAQKENHAWRDSISATLNEARGRQAVVALLFGTGSSVVVGLVVGFILHWAK